MKLSNLFCMLTYFPDANPGSQKTVPVTPRPVMVTSMPSCNIEHCLEWYQSSVNGNSSISYRCRVLEWLDACMSRVPSNCAHKDERFRFINSKRNLAKFMFKCNFPGLISSWSGTECRGLELPAVLTLHFQIVTVETVFLLIFVFVCNVLICWSFFD